MPGEVISQESSLIERYNTLISGLELVNVRLAGVEVSAPTIYVSDTGRKLEAQISSSASYINISTGVVIRSRLEFTGRYSDEETAQISVNIDLEIIYTASEQMTDDIFSEFETRNLPLNAWPFFRELIHTMLARAGWPLYTLPAFKSHPSVSMRKHASDATAEPV